MKNQKVQINLFDKKDNSTSTLYVEKLAENKFRMADNDIFNCRLTKGVEFTTRINNEGNHEIIKITKESNFITRRFFLSTKHKQSEYGFLASELIKYGGFCEVDFGGIATINIPKDIDLDIDQVMKDLDINLIEIVDD